MATLYGFSIDTRAISEYQQKLLRSEHQFVNFEKRFLQTLANMALEKVIPNTPVDTGRLRNSWKVSKVEQKGNEVQITIYNDARNDGMDESYASYVEYGHFTRNRLTWVEGRFMLTVATDQLVQEMTRVWNQMFDDWVKEMGL